MTDPRYVYGTTCTWHSPIVEAEYAGDFWQGDTAAVCPKCSGPLHVLATEEDFWRLAQVADREDPGHEAMLRWSKGKCFQDFDTLQNVYRQALATEGQAA